MRTLVASFPNTSDRVVGSEAAGIPRRGKETLVLLSVHPWIYSVPQRLESPTVSAMWYGHDCLRSFRRAHREQPVSANKQTLRMRGPASWSTLSGHPSSDLGDGPQPARSGHGGS